jgi:linoleoyl-CoA desaturase
MQEIKFNGNQSDFYIDLRKRVNEYFKDTNKEKTGDYRIIVKALFFSISFITSYILLVFVDMPVWLSIPLCVYAGIITVLVLT